jgi:GNAT superfamily N-acetyltransferase
MTLIVRDFRPADAGDAAEALQGAFPYLVTTPQAVAWQVANAPAAQRHRLLVAEADGRVVGMADTGIHFESGEPGQAFANLAVHPEQCGRGAGTALLVAAEDYLAGLGASIVYTWALGEERSLAFATRHGYRRSRSARFQRLDLASTPLPALAALPSGVELRTAADFADDPRPLYVAYAEAREDEPGDVDADAMGFGDWIALIWNRPDLDRELTSVAVVDGTVAAFSAAHTDGRSRYWSAMTGTRRAFRGRGLAKVAKNDSLHRARAAGYAEALTGNDTDNAPMLAINKWFGYQPAATEWRCVRHLAG